MAVVIVDNGACPSSIHYSELHRVQAGYSCSVYVYSSREHSTQYDSWGRAQDVTAR